MNTTETTATETTIKERARRRADEYVQGMSELADLARHFGVEQQAEMVATSMSAVVGSWDRMRAWEQTLTAAGHAPTRWISDEFLGLDVGVRGGHTFRVIARRSALDAPETPPPPVPTTWDYPAATPASDQGGAA